MIGFLQGNVRALAMKSNLDFLSPEPHIREQSYWRLGEVAKNSPKCLEEGQCIHCGCAVEEKVLENRACSGNCYPEMMNNVVWYFYKKDHNIKIEV